MEVQKLNRTRWSSRDAGMKISILKLPELCQATRQLACHDWMLTWHMTMLFFFLRHNVQHTKGVKGVCVAHFKDVCYTHYKINEWTDTCIIMVTCTHTHTLWSWHIQENKFLSAWVVSQYTILTNNISGMAYFVCVKVWIKTIGV